MAGNEVISQWSTLIENLETSPMGFFESVEAGITKRCIPEVQLSRVDHHESGIFSPKREYMRVTRDKLIFDICASPYGTGFFVSYWLGLPTVSPAIVFGIIVSYLFLAGLLGILIPIIGFFLAIFAIPVGLFILSSSSNGRVDQYVFAVPVIGYIYKRFFKPDTYYSMDSTTMFRTATHAAVLEAIDGLMNSRGLRLLSEDARRPTLRGR